MRLDNINQKLLNLLQAEFPLTSKPYAGLGQRLGIAENGVIQRIGQFKADGLIRQIGPVLNAVSLGYKTTLIAMRVTETESDKAVRLIIEHPGVSHAYERDHHFNLWFTLAVPATVDAKAELSRMTGSIKAEAVFALPAVRLFKLRTHFALGRDGQTEVANNHDVGVRNQQARLSPADRTVINELQQDLPLAPRPFADMSARSGMDEEEFLSRCQSLLSRGIMRRFSAAVNHRKVGFTANGMACWIVSPEKVEAVGQKLASLRQVSHCYERKTNPLWRYNLFAMIHGYTKEECRQVSEKVCAETGLTDYVMLFSTKEFKKTRVKYLV